MWGRASQDSRAVVLRQDLAMYSRRLGPGVQSRGIGGQMMEGLVDYFEVWFLL